MFCHTIFLNFNFKKLFLNISHYSQENTLVGVSFYRLARLKTWNFLKKGLQHRCFPVNIAKFLSTLILMIICEQLLLQFLLLTVNISSWVLTSALNSIGLLQRSSSRFKEFSIRCAVAGSSLIWKENLTRWSLVAIRCHSLYHPLSFLVTRCYFLLFLVTRCHSLSFVVTLCTTRSHSLYHLLSLVVTHCHSMYHSSVFS